MKVLNEIVGRKVLFLVEPSIKTSFFICPTHHYSFLNPTPELCISQEIDIQ